jgi:hypothetical protein
MMACDACGALLRVAANRCVLAAALMFFAVAAARGQDDPPERTVAFDGFEIFRQIVHHNKLAPLNKLDDILKAPADTVLIVLGDTRQIDDRRLNKFIASGGNALVAAHSFDLNGVHANGAMVMRHPAAAYREIPSCPWLALGPFNKKATHPLFHLILRGIATNAPSHLDIDENPNIEPLLPFPMSKRFDQQWYMAGSNAEAGPNGRVLFIAGQGMFVNGMLAQNDCDNFKFANNAIAWLSETTKTTPRKRALLMIDGTIETEFNANLTLPPPIPMPKAQMINRLLRGLEDERFFHRVLEDSLDDYMERILTVLFVSITCGLLLYGAKKFLQGRALPDLAAPRMVGKLQPGAASATPLAQRRAAKLQQANFLKDAQRLARAWLQREFALDTSAWTPSIRAELQVTGFWGSGALQKHGALVLGLARLEPRLPLDRHQYAAFIAGLKDLVAALREGRITLLIDGKNVKQRAK